MIRRDDFVTSLWQAEILPYMPVNAAPAGTLPMNIIKWRYTKVKKELFMQSAQNVPIWGAMWRGIAQRNSESVRVAEHDMIVTGMC